MKKNFNANAAGDSDFLFDLFFAGDAAREKFFTGRYSRRTRGPDRQPRQQRPWLIGESQHARILELLREGRGKVWIAQQLGVGVSTVQRRAAILRREGDEEGMVDFRTVRGEVCEKHGAVTVWPCVQCLAEEEKAKRGMN